MLRDHPKKATAFVIAGPESVLVKWGEAARSTGIFIRTDKGAVGISDGVIELNIQPISSVSDLPLPIGCVALYVDAKTNIADDERARTLVFMLASALSRDGAVAIYELVESGPNLKWIGHTS